LNKRLLFLLLLIGFMNVLNCNSYASTVVIFKDEVESQISENSFLMNGITYVNAYQCLAEFGYTYISTDEMITAVKEERKLIFYADQSYYIDSDQIKILSSQIIKKNNIFYMPLRAFSQLNNYSLDWSASTNSIQMNKIQDTTMEIERIIPQHFVQLQGLYALNDIEQDIKFASEFYTELVDLKVIGNTFEGRPIYAIKVGVDTGLEKPSILLMANIHGREDFTSMLDMKMLDYILYQYYESGRWGNYDLKDLLSKIDIWFIPVANPDGLNITQNGIASSKNYNALKLMDNIAKDDRWWKSNANGVDLNRNFDDGNWSIKTSYKRKSSEGFKGDKPNSELETKAIQKFCRETKPLMAISYHSSGNIMYWADSDTHSIFEDIDTTIVERMSVLTGYTSMPISQDPKLFSAGFENWFKSELQRFCICIEVSPHPGKPYVQHSDWKFDQLVWNQAKYTGLQMAVEALNYQNAMYDVYQKDFYLKTFYSEEKAKQFAGYYKNSSVMNKGIVLE